MVVKFQYFPFDIIREMEFFKMKFFKKKLYLPVFFGIGAIFVLPVLFLSKKTLGKEELSYVVLKQEPNFDNVQTVLPVQDREMIVVENFEIISSIYEPEIFPRFSDNNLSSGDLEELFKHYSNEYGVDEGLLKKIAYCESHYNSEAVNGPYGGMFQFTASSWASARNRMGLDNNSDLRFNSEEAIKTAAFKISQDGTAAWPACR